MISLRWQIQNWVFFSRNALKVNPTHIDLRTKPTINHKLLILLVVRITDCMFHFNFIDAGIFFGVATYFLEFILLVVYRNWSKYTRTSASNKVNVTYTHITLTSITSTNERCSVSEVRVYWLSILFVLFYDNFIKYFRSMVNRIK